MRVLTLISCVSTAVSIYSKPAGSRSEVTRESSRWDLGSYEKLDLGAMHHAPTDPWTTLSLTPKIRDGNKQHANFSVGRVSRKETEYQQYYRMTIHRKNVEKLGPATPLEPELGDCGCETYRSLPVALLELVSHVGFFGEDARCSLDHLLEHKGRPVDIGEEETVGVDVLIYSLTDHNQKETL